MTMFGAGPPRGEYDVAIIGLGPVGATLANLLAMQHLRVLVVEREADIYDLPRAVQFDGECMRVFQTIGIAHEMAPDLMPVPGMRFVDSHGNIIIDWSRPTTLGPHGWYASYRFHQPYLETSLRRRLQTFETVDVFLRHELATAELLESGVALRLKNLEAETFFDTSATYVVGCDGARSTIRRTMGTKLDDLKSHDRWLVLDVLLNRDRPDLGDYAIQYCDHARPATYIRGIGQRRRWELMLSPSTDAGAISRPDTVWEMLARWITPDEATIERSAIYTFHSVVACGWRVGRLLIAGDAAHQTPPFMGQGMCAGIRDASNLAWKLGAVINGAAHETLLDTYETERSPHVRNFIEEAVRLGAVIRDTGREVAEGGAAASQSRGKFVTPEPPLGPGAHKNYGKAGRISEQPIMGDGRFLDDHAGYHGILLVSAALAEAASQIGGGIKAIAADSAASLSYLQKLQTEAVLIRPDRYIYGTCDTAEQLENLFHGYVETCGAQ